MTEKLKDSSSAKSMEKTSLIDLDIAKDFLTSWKSMSVTEDDPMDFDFAKDTKGNKQAFKFENLDMDFNLDNDFGKISSFNVDIPDLDVSSPVKNSAKPKEKSEVSAERKAQGKLNRSTFQFDFNEFDDISFGPSLMKKTKQTNANQDAEPSLSPSGSLGLKETIGAFEGEGTSTFDSQLCAEPDSRVKEKLQTSSGEVHIPSKSEISIDQATKVGATTSSQKPSSNSTQETFQDICRQERITYIEPYTKDKCRNSSVQSVSENSLTRQTPSNSQEEVGHLDGKERTNTGREQSLYHDKTDIGINCGDQQTDKLPVKMAGLQSNEGENSQFSGDNHVRVDNKYNAEPGQGDSQFEQTCTSASKQVLCKTEADGETMDLTLELVTQSNSETTGGGREMSDPKPVTETVVVRSKYSKGSDEANSQRQQSSLSQTKIATFDSKRVETVQLSCADKGAIMDAKAMPDEESLPNIRSESFKGLDGTKSHPQQDSLFQENVGSVGSQRITTSQPCIADERKLDNEKAQTEEQTKEDSICVGSQGTPSNQTSNRRGCDSYDTRIILTNTSRLDDMDVDKGEPALNGTKNNVKDFNTFRYNNQNGRSPSGRKLHRKDAQSGNSVIIPKAIPREQIEVESVRTRSEGSIKEPTSNRTLTGTSMLHYNNATESKVVSDGSRNSVKYFDTLSSHVETSTSNEQTNRIASLLGLNPKLQVSGMKSTQNKISSPDNKKNYHLKDGIRAPVLCNLENMRTSESFHPPMKSTLQKDTKLLTNSGGADLKGNTGPSMAHHADTKKQAPLSPTLKRKKFEDSSANLVLLKPKKRLIVSPSGSRNSKELSEKLVDKENLLDCNTKKVLNSSQSSCLHFPQKVDIKELETPFEMDNDTSVESAEACAKELNNLVSMLKKKHEEAKEILVRAVVNNNKLLMLNHPIYEEKFRMIEKFGGLWLSK